MVVGPLVRPGVSPCLNCLDLHRLDRDPAWRVIAAQLQATARTDPLACTTALAGAAFAAAEVLTPIDGGTPADARHHRRDRWARVTRSGDVGARHPACGCTRRRRTQDDGAPNRCARSVSIDRVTDIPRRAVGRTARLAALPLGFAGRAALGFGKRVTGMAADVISAEVQQRTAEHLFKVLGQLKGGAMKLGQAMSVFEAALPEEIAGPYRAALTKLQEAAPPLPAATVHKVLAEELGAALAAAVQRVRRCAGRRGEHRPGAPGGVAGRPDRRGQDPVPGRRRRAHRRPRPAVPAGRALPGDPARASTSSRW